MAGLAAATGLVVRLGGAVVTGAGLAAAAHLGLSDPRRSQPQIVSRRLLDAAGVSLGSALLASVLPEHWPWLLPALMIAALSWIAVRTDDLRLRRTAVIALVVLVATPLGSSNGLRLALFGFWLALPLLLWFGWTGAAHLLPMAGTASRSLTTVVFSALAAVGMSTAWHTPYRDVPDRRRLVHAVDAPFVSTGRTHDARAAVVSDLSRVLARHVTPGDELLVHGSCPLLHVITRTRPALGNTWPALYPLAVFKERLDALGTRVSRLPAVVMSAGSCRDAQWPERRTFNSGERAQRQQLLAFMSARAYEQVWSNGFFSLWTVP